MNDVDLSAVEARQNRSRDHVVDGPERGLTAPEIKHAIKDAEKLAEFMGAEHHRDAALATEAPDKVGRAPPGAGSRG